MSGKLSAKVVIDNAYLSGSHDERFWRDVATVYIRDEIRAHGEYRVVAPPKASGDALEWADYWKVRHMSPQGYPEVNDGYAVLAIRMTREELESRSRDQPMGMNPDGMHHDAFICHAAHIQSSFGDAPRTKFCEKCGAPVIANCLHCKAPIRGQLVNTAAPYISPNFCHDCGRPYPWMEDRLTTAHELLNNDDKLQLEDRKELWGLLQYVMSSPKADLAPAKRKLIDIKLGKAAQITRDLVLELVVKYAAEMSKG